MTKQELWWFGFIVMLLTQSQVAFTRWLRCWLNAVHIEGMGKQTLVCAGGTTGVKYIGVFTPTEYRMYGMHSALCSPKIVQHKS